MAKKKWITRFGLHLLTGSRAWKWALRHLKPAKPPKPVLPIHGCDYAEGPTAAQVKKAKMAFVFRYVAPSGAAYDWKRLTMAEADALHKAGIDIGIVFEGGGGAWVGGRAAGIAAGKAAVAELTSLGVPGTVACYFAIDTDSRGHEKTVCAYIAGVASVLGVSRTGVYAGYSTVTACAQAKVCKFTWQTRAWSEDSKGVVQWFASNDVEQYGGGTINGHSIDLDRALHLEFGAWKAQP